MCLRPISRRPSPPDTLPTTLQILQIRSQLTADITDQISSSDAIEPPAPTETAGAFCDMAVAAVLTLPTSRRHSAQRSVNISTAGAATVRHPLLLYLLLLPFDAPPPFAASAHAYRRRGRHRRSSPISSAPSHLPPPPAHTHRPSKHESVAYPSRQVRAPDSDIQLGHSVRRRCSAPAPVSPHSPPTRIHPCVAESCRRRRDSLPSPPPASGRARNPTIISLPLPSTYVTWHGASSPARPPPHASQTGYGHCCLGVGRGGTGGVPRTPRTPPPLRPPPNREPPPRIAVA